MARRDRIDVVMATRGLVESRAIAQRLVMAGQVRVDGQTVLKPSHRVALDAEISIEESPRYVSRGGVKLAAALDAFPIRVEGRVCADVGSSTGGFTDCLLQHGARRVYAIDVGHGVLHWRLRVDPKVVVMEDTNARLVRTLPEPVGLATIDASFISLKLLFPAVARWLAPEADVVCLVKPQFEAGRKAVGRGGVVRKTEVHRAVLADLLPAVTALGLSLRGLIRSPLLGPKGNVEFLLWSSEGGEAIETESLIAGVFPDEP